jgi:hypothetical protein
VRWYTKSIKTYIFKSAYNGPCTFVPCLLVPPVISWTLTCINAQMLLSYLAWDTKLSENQCQQFSIATEKDGTQKVSKQDQRCRKSDASETCLESNKHPYLPSHFLEEFLDIQVLYSSLLHLSSLSFHCVGGCMDINPCRTVAAHWHWQTGALTTRLDRIDSQL